MLTVNIPRGKKHLGEHGWPMISRSTAKFPSVRSAFQKSRGGKVDTMRTEVQSNGSSSRQRDFNRNFSVFAGKFITEKFNKLTISPFFRALGRNYIESTSFEAIASSC